MSFGKTFLWKYMTNNHLPVYHLKHLPYFSLSNQSQSYHWGQTKTYHLYKIILNTFHNVMSPFSFPFFNHFFINCVCLRCLIIIELLNKCFWLFNMYVVYFNFPMRIYILDSNWMQHSLFYSNCSMSHPWCLCKKCLLVWYFCEIDDWWIL